MALTGGLRDTDSRAEAAGALYRALNGVPGHKIRDDLLPASAAAQQAHGAEAPRRQYGGGQGQGENPTGQPLGRGALLLLK